MGGGGGVAVVGRAAKGWQVDSTARFGPNVVSFLLTLGARLWYVVGAYVNPNDAPDIHSVDKDLRASPKGLDMVLMGDLNARPGDPHDKREEDLATALADRDLVNMTDYFLPRRRYRGESRWTWSMQREGRRATGKGDYILSIDMPIFTNVGLRETRHGTDQRMIVAVLLGKGCAM